MTSAYHLRMAGKTAKYRENSEIMKNYEAIRSQFLAGKSVNAANEQWKEDPFRGKGFRRTDMVSLRNEVLGIKQKAADYRRLPKGFRPDPKSIPGGGNFKNPGLKTIVEITSQDEKGNLKSDLISLITDDVTSADEEWEGALEAFKLGNEEGNQRYFAKPVDIFLHSKQWGA